MSTQKIKVEIEAVVPVGKYCYDLDGDIQCRDWMHEHSRFNPTEHDTCLIHRWVKLEKIETDYDIRTHILKCQQCLDACENGMERGLEELAGGQE